MQLSLHFSKDTYPKKFGVSPKKLSAITRTKSFPSTWFDGKVFRKTKKTVTADKGQTISRLSCLTVTVTRIFRQFVGFGLSPTTPAGFFPQSEYIPP